MRIRRGIVSALTALTASLALTSMAAAQRRDTAPVRIEIEGIDGDLRQNALSFLSLADAARELERLSPALVRRLHDRAAAEIRESLQPFGYYRTRVDSNLRFADSAWIAQYTVEPGRPLQVSRVDLRLTGQGRNEERLQQALEAFPLRRGDVLDHAAYRRGKTRLRVVATDLGYLNASFDTSQIRVDIDAYEATIALHVDTGPLHVFGDVSFAQDILERDVLDQYVPFRPGDRYDTAELIEMQSNLSGSPYFSRAEVRPRVDLRDGRRIPIHVELEPQSPRRYEVGIGYGTDTGFRGRAAAELRRLNRNGHRAQAEVRLAFIERTATGRYLVPRPFGGIVMLTLFGGYQNLSPESSNSDKIRGGFSLNDDLADWRQSYSLIFEHESYEVGPDTASSDLLMLETSWRKSVANDRVFPTRGFDVNLELRGAEDALFSSTSFAQLHARGSFVLSLASRTRVIARGELGAALTSDFHDLPASLRFFAGGDQSVRGYAYRSLAPTDRDGEPIGGDRLLVASVELEQRFLDDWGVAAFFDTGNALDSFSLDLEQGTGLGLRWISPIGQVRLDGAFAISQPGTPFRLHLRIGPGL